MDDLLFSYAEPTDPPLRRKFIRLVERATGQPKLKRLYLDHQRTARPGDSFFEAAVRKLDLQVEIDPARHAAIPRTGPLVIVANHPYGVLDGIVISWLTERVRADFKVLTNAVLLRAPEAAPYLLPVDFAPTEEAMATNLETRNAARRHLEAGGCIVVFPAGGISTAPDRLGRKPAIDAPWQPFTSQLIQRSRATVVPMYFEGQNSRLFQIASHIHPAARLSLVFKEVRDRIGTVMRVGIGEPIPFAEIAHISDRRAMVDHLRTRTEALRTELERVPNPPRRRRRPAVLRRLSDALERRRGRRAVSTRGPGY